MSHKSGKAQSTEHVNTQTQVISVEGLTEAQVAKLKQEISRQVVNGPIVEYRVIEGVDFSETPPDHDSSILVREQTFLWERVLLSRSDGGDMITEKVNEIDHGNTALHESSWRGYSQLVKVLSSPAAVDKQNHGGFTALHLSCQAGHNQSTRELLLAGSNPNVVNTFGDAAIHTSVRYGHAGVARILLSARADPNLQNKNKDCPIHIASAFGRKKLTKILLVSGCRTNLRNHQNETALDISNRKGFNEISELFKHLPPIVSPILRDEIRASKYKSASSGPSSTGNISGGKKQSNNKRVKSDQSHHSDKKSGGGGSNGHKHAEKSKEGGSKKSSKSNNNDPDITPNWSPYGCHYHPNPEAFPSPKIDSLPNEPLRSGELYYLDLAGNIHKGPVGVSEGCYCSQFFQPVCTAKDNPAQCAKNYEDQLHTLTSQLAKIHLDTQAQLSSLQAMLNEKLVAKTSQNPINYDENKLKDWVRQYRRFRKELSKNPKALIQANELLENASALMVTTTSPPSPAADEESDSDSGL
ncbi:Ankyrin repeat domain-containing protein 6 [Folsomia candida]|uniref:Ankyrin repeat domain-containing protein 6 n=1 Tax=Folsomia candida TaxID=158441 RepID=A0A226F5G3_FOLCA|nr:Ankyrin repeat domain-containing protein 6 [Folsomia candida]